MTIEQAAKVLTEAIKLEKWDSGSWLYIQMNWEEWWMKVWTWAKGKEWWIEFLSGLNGYLGAGSCAIEELNHIPVKYVGSPDFIIEVAEFLEGREKK